MISLNYKGLGPNQPNHQYDVIADLLNGAQIYFAILLKERDDDEAKSAAKVIINQLSQDFNAW